VISHLLSDAEAISASLSALDAIVEQFAASIDLMPVDCDEAIVWVNTLNEPTSRLQRILKQPEILPPIVAAQCFDLLALLRFIEAKSREATVEISRYRLICYGSDPGAAHQRVVIQRRIEMLVQVGEKVSKRLMIILDSFSVSNTNQYAH
jgi:hypothetical protein